MLLIGWVISTAFIYCTEAQSPASPRVTTEGKQVKVSYGQPSKRNRSIFGGLVPFGQVWRTGANKASEITFEKEVIFAGQPLKPGTYSLFTIPAKEQWTIILNSQLNQRGAFEYDKYKNKNVLEVKVPVMEIHPDIEKLTYRFNEKNHLVIEWETTRVTIPIEDSSR